MIKKEIDKAKVNRAKNLSRECLIIFTRYPEPGKTKTRLIPALGAEKAAQLQRQMTEHTIKQAKKLQQHRFLSIRVYFAGANQDLMQEWLGDDFDYQPQSRGDLGAKMGSAFAESFIAGMTKVAIIGIDCPDVDATILSAAFDALTHSDLVLGPAADGGYYLIGLNCLIPELFTGIDWGTSQVLSTTKRIAQKLGLKTYSLPLLNDVDRPEDLVIWERYSKKKGVT